MNIYKEAIYKRASLDAVRKKQYWGILKRMYGGGDEAIKAMKSSGDTGVYHGSKATAKQLTDTKVMPATERSIFGKGAYFGSKDSASQYVGSNGALIRLKKPSELKGSKDKYPNINSVRNSDLRVNPKLSSQDLRRLQTFGPGANDVDFIRKYREKHTKGENLPVGWEDVKYRNRTLLDKDRYTKARQDMKNNPGMKSMFQDFAKMEHTSLNQKLKNDIEAMSPKMKPFAPTSEPRVMFRQGVSGKLVKDTVEPEVKQEKRTLWDKFKKLIKKGE
jgi:hypothetical protein